MNLKVLSSTYGLRSFKCVLEYTHVELEIYHMHYHIFYMYYVKLQWCHFFPPQFRTDIARTEYLSNADERLRWQANSLPADDLCTENAIMLKRFNRSGSFSSCIAVMLLLILSLPQH